MDQPHPSLSSTKKRFTFKKKQPTRAKYKIKQKDTFRRFTDLCNTHNIQFFEFYDSYSWTGPAIKVLEKDFITITSLFEDSGLDTMTLNGIGFVVIRPVGAGNNSNIYYNKETYNTIGFTKKPIIPYNSDSEDDDDNNDDNTLSNSDSSENVSIVSSDDDIYDDDDIALSDISVEESFIAEEWKYNGTIYLLDPKNNNLYFPSTYEFIGKKTSEFSIDFDAKET